MPDIVYIFPTPLRYGDAEEFQKVSVSEPTILHMPLVAKIKESYNLAVMDMVKRFEGVGKKPEEGNATEKHLDDAEKKEELKIGIRAVLDSACQGTAALYENFQALLLSDEIAVMHRVDGTPKSLKKGYLNKIGIKDFMNITVEYLFAFILPAS